MESITLDGKLFKKARLKLNLSTLTFTQDLFVYQCLRQNKIFMWIHIFEGYLVYWYLLLH